MSFVKKTLLIIVVFITIGLLGYSTWHQWRDNRTTILERMRPIPPIATFSHGGSIRHIAFDPKNPELLATAGDGKFVKIWNRNNHESPQLTLEYQKDNDGTTFIVGIAFSPTDNWIVTKSFWTLEFWDSLTGERINKLGISSSNLTIYPTGKFLIMDSAGIALWNSSDPNNIKSEIMLPPEMGWESINVVGLEKTSNFGGRESIHLDIQRKHSDAGMDGNIRDMDISSDGKWFVAGGKDYDRTTKKWCSKLKIWNMERQQLFKSIEREEPIKLDPKPKNKRTVYSSLPPSNDIRSVKFSPNNRFFGLAADNGYTIWSLPDWKIYHEVLDQRTSDIAFSPDGSMYAVADVKSITLWNIETLTPIAMLKGKGILAMVTTIEFSPDCNTIAGGGFDGVLRLWDMRDYYAE